MKRCLAILLLLAGCARPRPEPVFRHIGTAQTPPLPVAMPHRAVSAPRIQSLAPFTFTQTWQLPDGLDATAYTWTVQTSSNLTDWADYPTYGSVTLAWDANSDPTIGYRLYSGLASKNYTQVMDAGITNVATVVRLLSGATNFFAVTAYNTLESAFSAELTFCLCGPPAAFTITSAMATNPAAAFRLKGTPK